ncbi:glycosyltransferase family 2 protein [Flavobacterium sp. NRK F7]|uniref:glycosyltransferase family 2 protein n=1 Tax=Flavobacterium sp. NRK F7 TaxID=2954930 RepID=UPI0020916B85|nr:glycosyltransferase family 2 protein [Flavobacterium sp. NRK F7]MCO6164224.1 glycosyltransferase family 2 protein [Flavobacterium sp. NRK F7]
MNQIIPKITVFTPSYNRAYCLSQVYESLLRQTCKDFIWLIIDDGSSDGTKELVASWINENKITIQYVFQLNQGMHGAYNTAYETIQTELNVCIDSDDYLTDNCIEKIILFWEKYGSNKYAGIVGLDATKDGKVLGKEMPKNRKSATLEDLYYKYKINGDKKLVYRTEIVKKYPKYPIFEGESFVPLGSLYLQIDKDYELLCLNEVLCIVEYLEDGSSLNIFKQYVRHPKGFRYARLIEMQFSNYFKIRWKAAIHYVSCNLFLKQYNFFKNNPYFINTFFAIPFGILLNLYIKYRNKN